MRFPGYKRRQVARPRSRVVRTSIFAIPGQQLPRGDSLQRADVGPANATGFGTARCAEGDAGHVLHQVP